MRIAFIDVTATVSFGGIQTAVWRLTETLAAMGHEVHVFGGEGELRPFTPHPDIHIHTFPFKPREQVLDLGSRYRRIVERRSMAKHAKAKLAEIAPDWAILTKPFDFFWPGLMPAGSKTRFAFMSGGTDFFAGDRRLSKRIEAWVACSHFNAWQIRAHYKHQPKVMYNGVDVDHFSPQSDAAATRAALGFSAQATVFAFAGRLVGWKGMGVAIRALADPKLADRDVHLLLIGDGEQRPELEALSQRLGLEKRVHFHGKVPHNQLPTLYSAIDAGVFPSIGDEAFGITIAEAMSCAKPVIGTYIGGIPEVIGNEGTCGELVAVDDSQALAGAMRRLADDAELRQRMGQAARHRIVENYSWRMAAERMLDALDHA
ncbi:MAG: glycosyltransferase family 4 protein [Gammaproteobacteria bacterium]|nr:glycosyltransferase family 4 protein [Gammaproteobacteria bacterium]